MTRPAVPWPMDKDGFGGIIVTEISEDSAFTADEDKIVLMTEGWTEGLAAAVLRGGINAKAVLEVMARSGIKDVVIFHNEERIQQLEEIFLTTVVNQANALFKSVKIVWRHDPSIFDLIQTIGKDFNMLFIGAPLAKSEIAPLYRRIKQVYKGSLSIVRGPSSELEFSPGDEVLKWVRERTFEATDFSLSAVLRSCKNRLNVKIDVILPALNEEKTIGKVIETALEVKSAGIIDEVIVVDSDSTDNTVEIAKSYRVPVFKHREIEPAAGSFHGKGEAMFKSTFVSNADILAWIDTDIVNITPTFFYGLLGPMLANPEIKFVKGYFERPVRVEASGVELGGGRVTEILVRPWLNTYMPQLSGYIQPLAGTVAIYRKLLQKMKIPTNYGVEIAMLIQAVEQGGLWSTCQVNLGEVIHKSKDVRSLSEMAFQILQVLKSMQNCFSPGNSTLRQIFSAEGHFEVGIKKFDVTWREFNLKLDESRVSDK